MSSTIDICGTCKNRSFHAESGVVCGLTGKKPAFINHCKDYDRDMDRVKEVKWKAKQAEQDRQRRMIYRFALLVFVLIIGFFIYQVALSIRQGVADGIYGIFHPNLVN